jgi:hypothetical protein
MWETVEADGVTWIRWSEPEGDTYLYFRGFRLDDPRGAAQVRYWLGELEGQTPADLPRRTAHPDIYGKPAVLIGKPLPP